MTMRSCKLLVPLMLMLGVFMTPAQADSIAPPKIEPEAGNTYFTRVTFYQEKDVHQATNFGRGEVWPINTEVRLKSISDRRHGRLILERVDNGEEVTIQNVPRHTDIDIHELASRMLADQRTPIEQLPEDFQRAIKAGELRLGMSKEVALMARGYPPATHTPNLDSDTWVYQQNRFARHTIVFEDGEIVEGRGLR